MQSASMTRIMVKVTPDNMFFSIAFVKTLEREEGWAGTNLINGTIHYTYIYRKIKVPSESFEEAKAKVAANKNS